MFLLIVIVILITSSIILGNIYMGLFSFQQNYKDLDNYYNSYYSAISAVERGLLVTKYKQPGFNGTGGFLGTSSWGSVSDLLSGDLGQLNKNENGFYREINSRTKNISGNINYNDMLEIQMTLDTSTDTYNNTLDTEISHDFFDNNANIILNITKEDSLGEISPVDISSIKRKLYTVNNYNDNYIIANNNINDSNQIINNDINENINILFSQNTIDIHDLSFTEGSGFCTNVSCYGPNTSIGDILSGGYITGLVLNITGNYIKTNNDIIIPHLTYNIISSADFANKVYEIQGKSTIGNYKKSIYISKPTSNYNNPNIKNFIFPYYQ